MNSALELSPTEVSTLAAPAGTLPVERPERPVAVVQNADSLFGAIIKAAEGGVDVDRIEKLMSLYDRVRENEARMAFNEAFAAFKAEAITVSRNRAVTDGPLRGRRYAELFSFVDAATPALSKHGLSASWCISRDEKDWIEVTCTIEHALGGNKKVSLGGPPDSGGAKNPLQARISTVTYLERVTFKAACGLAEQGDDDDGQSAGKKASADCISADQVAEMQALIDDIGGAGADALKAQFLKWARVETLADIPANRFRDAMAGLENRRKAS